MTTQRKYRNAAERQAIYEEIMSGLNQLQIASHPMAKPLLEALELFRSDAKNRQFDGTIEIAPMGIKLDYRLSGRRIVPHYVRASRLDIPTPGTDQQDLQPQQQQPIVVDRSTLPL